MYRRRSVAFGYKLNRPNFLVESALHFFYQPCADRAGGYVRCRADLRKTRCDILVFSGG